MKFVCICARIREWIRQIAASTVKGFRCAYEAGFTDPAKKNAAAVKAAAFFPRTIVRFGGASAAPRWRVAQKRCWMPSVAPT
ncbi:hypothetical protein [Burkholderia gladioli]|uniref:hypothetical protein n=1 Tax=Burkholderia gladioli TaxID=28095 RepID=UPI001641FE8C|nr:hypothetical protein [Burkholderia gladioli]